MSPEDDKKMVMGRISFESGQSLGPVWKGPLRKETEERSWEKQEEKYWGVQHPDHYVKGRKFEPWDVMEDWKLNYFTASAVKYISRYERKGDPIGDIEKAIKFLERELQRLKKETL